MARPLRILMAGGWYHVLNRGHRRSDLFLTDTDRQRFLGLAERGMADALAGRVGGSGAHRKGMWPALAGNCCKRMGIGDGTGRCIMLCDTGANGWQKWWRK